MPSDDLRDFATSTIDFYELLGLGLEFSQKELDRSWRRTALKYHPDKCGPDEEAKRKFHLAQIGYDLLSDASSKGAYDNARTARLQKQRQNELFEGRRRQMKEDLEAGERGVKRRRGKRRLAEDGKRRRKEREDALRKEMDDAAEQTIAASTAPPPGWTQDPRARTSERRVVSENDRTVKVRIIKKKDNGKVTEAWLRSLFIEFGRIETVDIIPSSSEKKRYTASVLFASIVGAHDSVVGFQSGKLAKWKMIDLVDWLTGKEPDCLGGHINDSKKDMPQSQNASNGATSFSGPNDSHTSSTPSSNNNQSAEKKPSFASFSAAGLNGTKTSSTAVNSPTLEEMTLIRLRKLEQKALAAEIERSDREADANGQ